MKLFLYNINMKNNNINNLLKSNGFSVTKPRVQIIKILQNSNSPIGIDAIINKTDGKIAISSAYRIIADLLDADLINAFQSPENKLLVELIQNNTKHHHHLYCQSCKKVLDIDIDEKLEKNIDSLIRKISKQNNIEITNHSFELFGKCNDKSHE
jgi:Fe2+ or Zn2+ uptake regulation protein